MRMVVLLLFIVVTFSGCAFDRVLGIEANGNSVNVHNSGDSTQAEMFKQLTTTGGEVHKILNVIVSIDKREKALDKRVSKLEASIDAVKEKAVIHVLVSSVIYDYEVEYANKYCLSIKPDPVCVAFFTLRTKLIKKAVHTNYK